ncbi:hypothetical protein RHGRI_033241 [Rhododendron griersonianum]|uniref:DUF4408 domain-containing protein n=1 Tax=Rhododendron griersonianum TaxID=479676 RepID=A0AAV6HVZ2_9ERIC|nr:hypothetical protein RHGRI_033241 [Rhododendron griersonianum]
MNQLAFVSLPNFNIPFFSNPKFLFIVGNAIIVFLVGESKLSNPPPSPATEIYNEGPYNEYVGKSQKNCEFPSQMEKKGEGKLEIKFLTEESVKNIEKQAEEREEEEEGGLETEELTKRVEDFIARVNRQSPLITRVPQLATLHAFPRPFQRRRNLIGVGVVDPFTVVIVDPPFPIVIVDPFPVTVIVVIVVVPFTVAVVIVADFRPFQQVIDSFTFMLEREQGDESKILFFKSILWKRYVEGFMKKNHTPTFVLSSQNETIFEKQKFDAPIISPASPQQRPGTVDCGIIVCYIIDKLAQGDRIPESLTTDEIRQYRVLLLQRFLHDKPRTWTEALWKDRKLDLKTD